MIQQSVVNDTDYFTPFNGWSVSWLVVNQEQLMTKVVSSNSVILETHNTNTKRFSSSIFRLHFIF